MRIISVKLENYRNHANKEIFFDKGLNLLLGKNGSGKSSILEAIGYALLNTGLRTTVDDTIKKGENTASIIVTFIAIDGLTYRVERQLKSGVAANWKLFLEGEKSPRAKTQKEILDKVRELIGIESNTENVYKNVITAYQNQLTQIFMETPVKRAEIFNQIFDTAIYRDMSDGYLKGMFDKYNREKDTKNTIITTKSENIKDSKALKNEIEELAVEGKILYDENEKVAKEIEHVKKILDFLINTKNKIEANKLKLENSNKNLHDAIDAQKTIESRLAECMEAINIVGANKSHYENYFALKEQNDKLTLRINELIKKNDEKSILEKNVLSSEGNIKEFSARIESNKKSISDLNNEIDNLSNQLTELEILYKADNEKKNEIQIKIDEKSNLLGKCNIHLKNLEQIEKNISDLNLKKEQIEKNIIDDGILTNEKSALSKNESDIQSKLLIKQKLEKEIEILDSRLLDNKEAHSKLSGGICPFLKEDCGNIKTGSSPDDFFNKKHAELTNSKNELSGEIAQYSGLEKQLREIQNNAGKIKQQISSNESNIIQLNQTISNIKIKKEELENEFLRLDLTLKDSDETVISEYDINSVKEIKSNQENKISGLRAEVSGIQANINQFNSRIGEINKRVELSKRNRDKIQNDNLEYEKQIKILNENIGSKNQEIQGISEIIKDLPALKNEQENSKNKLIELEPAYKLYMQNLAKSREIENIKIEYEQIKKRIEDLEKNIFSLNDEKNELEMQFSEIQLKDVSDELTELDKLKIEFTGKISEIASNLKYKQEELFNNEALLKEIAGLKKELSFLLKKLQITDYFRKKISVMGKLVASRLLERITIIATDNYQRISGKNEIIRWLNDDKNSYQVELFNDSNPDLSRKFEMLSGGEQVSVAISIRAALANSLTKSNFAIFDEPTVNLDDERRHSLTESLKTMLKGLEQAIIVTHDDSFREMAQRVEYLS